MGAHVRLSGSWSNVSDIYARVGGSWKEVTEGYVKLSGAWKQFFSAGTPLTVNYLVIAGGGGGAGEYVGGTFISAGGGGAGGYRTSAGTSGGGASAESALTLAVATNYTVTVGGGGAGGVGEQSGTNGSNSVFSTITSTGGGGGAARAVGKTGGSGGGGGQTFGGGAGTSNQGYAGGSATWSLNVNSAAGGGGGAGAVGSNGSGNTGGNGGNGVASTITGTSVTRAGGGGGGGYSAGGAGGTGGGGAGRTYTGNGFAGTANTGGGGGGASAISDGIGGNGGAGGSGVVILKYPDTYAISVSPGLNHMTTTSGGYRITRFLAGTGTVSFSEVAASDYELIGSVYLSSSQASVTFDLTGLSSTYKHLQIRGVARTDRSGADSDPVILQFNGDTGANYTRHGLGAYRFNGSGTHYSNSATSQTSIMVTENMPVSSSTANVFGVFVADILDPFQSTKNKTVRTLNGMNAAWASIELRSGAWLSTTPASSILLKPLVGANFVANCRFSIYGLKG